MTSLLPDGTGSSKKRFFQKRARSGLALGLLSFFAVQGAAAWAWHTYFAEWRDLSFYYKAVALDRRLAQSETPSRTIIMSGSSLTSHGFRAALMEKLLSEAGEERPLVFNLANCGLGPLGQYLYFRRAWERGLRPDLVLVEVYPILFDAGKLPCDLGQLTAHRLSRSEVPIVRRFGGAPDLEREWVIDNVAPLHGHRLSFWSRTFPLLIPNKEKLQAAVTMDACGWIPFDVMSEREKTHILSSLRNDVPAFKPGGKTFEVFEEYLNYLAERKLRTVLVVMPAGPYLRSLYPPRQLEKFYDRLHQVARQYRCTVLDGHAWLDDESGFLDSHHMNPSGAERFTRRLAVELLKENGR